MPENQEVQVMRFVDGNEDGHPDTIKSLEQLADYTFSESGCYVAAGTGFGQPIILMFRGPKDKVTVEIMDYKRLRHEYGGINPLVIKLIEYANGYLARIDAELRARQEQMFKKIKMQ